MARKHTPAHAPAPIPPPVTSQQLLAFLASDSRAPDGGYLPGMFALALQLGYTDTLLSSVRLRGYLDALVADACASHLHVDLLRWARPAILRARSSGCLLVIVGSARNQGLLPSFFAATLGDGAMVRGDFDLLVAEAGEYGYMSDLLADARQHGYLADLLAVAHSSGHFADLINAADPLDELLLDCKPRSYFLIALFDTAHAHGLLPKVLTASYATGQVADLLGWAKSRDLLGDLILAAHSGDTIAELLEHAAALGYTGDLLAASTFALDPAKLQAVFILVDAAAVTNFELDTSSIPVLERPYRTILGEVEIDLEARRDPFAFGSVADRLITMAGEVGVNLREKYGTTGAARLIHRKSRPDAPGLRCDDSTPLEWIVAYLRERAAEEPAVIEESVAVA